MSWQAYVDDNLVKSGRVDKAAFIAADGASAWANSEGFTVSPEEGKEISAILNGNDPARNHMWAEGVRVSGERYVVTRAEDRSLYARKGRTGIVAVKTKQAIIVGHYGEEQQAGNAAHAVESLADYLIGVGY